MVANFHKWKIFRQLATEVYKDIFDVSMYKIYNTVARVIFTVIKWGGEDYEKGLHKTCFGVL